jgi:hypothetical protein
MMITGAVTNCSSLLILISRLQSIGYNHEPKYISQQESINLITNSEFHMITQARMSASSLWFTFSQACMLCDLSNLLRLPVVMMPHTKNSLSTNAYEAGADM